MCSTTKDGISFTPIHFAFEKPRLIYTYARVCQLHISTCATQREAYTVGCMSTLQMQSLPLRLLIVNYTNNYGNKTVNRCITET